MDECSEHINLKRKSNDIWVRTRHKITTNS